VFSFRSRDPSREHRWVRKDKINPFGNVALRSSGEMVRSSIGRGESQLCTASGERRCGNRCLRYAMR